MLTIALGSFSLSIGGNADAHWEGQYYHSQWSGASPNVGWKFAPSFPSGGAKANRVKDAADTWDAASGHFGFNYNGVASGTYDRTHPCQGNYNGIFEPTSGVQYGETFWCENSHVISAFSLSMQEGTDNFWDTGDGNTGTNKYSAVITHEMGHATGFGTLYLETGDPDDMHFPFANTSSGICWDDADFHTMCNGLIPAPAKTATLEEHDIHTLQNRYGT
jgi:hypothetical protein